MARRLLCLGCVAVGMFGIAVGRLGWGVYYRGVPFLEAPNPPPAGVVGLPLVAVPWSLDNLTQAEWFHLAGLVLVGVGVIGYLRAAAVRVRKSP